MSIKKITSYRTDDDRLFQTEIEAMEHDDFLFMKKSIELFWRDFGYSGMTVHDITEICVGNIPRLQAALCSRNSE